MRIGMTPPTGGFFLRESTGGPWWCRFEEIPNGFLRESPGSFPTYHSKSNTTVGDTTNHTGGFFLLRRFSENRFLPTIQQVVSFFFTKSPENRFLPLLLQTYPIASPTADGIPDRVSGGSYAQPDAAHRGPLLELCAAQRSGGGEAEAGPSVGVGTPFALGF